MIFSRLNRARGSSGLSLNRMIGLSLLMHILALSLLIFSPSMPSPKWTFGPAYNVQLVNLQDISFKGNDSSVLSREILTPTPAKSAIVLKRPVDTLSSVPIRSVDVQRKQNPQREKAIEAVRKKLQSSERAAGRSTAARAESASSSAPGSREADDKMASYYAAVWSKIKGQWSLPRDILSKENIETVIQAKILRNGAISDVSFEKRSGNRFFDDSAMKAIKKANPLPPLPGWIRDNSIEIGIRFHSSEFQR